MDLLDLHALEFTRADYKEFGKPLRQRLITSLEFHPISYRKISAKTCVNYRALLNFANGRTFYMNYKNMCAVRKYIIDLMNKEVLHGNRA